MIIISSHCHSTESFSYAIMKISFTSLSMTTLNSMNLLGQPIPWRFRLLLTVCYYKYCYTDHGITHVLKEEQERMSGSKYAVKCEHLKCADANPLTNGLKICQSTDESWPRVEDTSFQVFKVREGNLMLLLKSHEV